MVNGALLHSPKLGSAILMVLGVHVAEPARNGPRLKSGRITHSGTREGMLANRKRFLLAFGDCGTISQAAKVIGVHRKTVEMWQKDPEFAEDLHAARLAFAEMLEGIALDRVRNPDKNRGSDVLLLGLLNANLPAKYRPQFAMSEDSAKDLIIEWRKAAQEVKKEEPPKDGGSLPEPLQSEVFEILMKKKEEAPKEREEG